MHLKPIKVRHGAALTLEDAKARAESTLKDWCAKRITPPDLKKLTPWRALTRPEFRT
jgi:hypothetical protein